MAGVFKNIGFSNGDLRNATGVFRSNGRAFNLRPAAAGALTEANKSFRGRFGIDIPVNEAHRSIDTQWYYWDLYQAGKGNLAAYPGNSNHGWGLAIDVDILSGEQLAWLKQNLPLCGWWWAGGTFGQVEDWHYEFDGRNTSSAKMLEYERVGGGSIIEEVLKENDMYIARCTDWGNKCVLISALGHKSFDTMEQLNNFRAATGIELRNCTFAQMFGAVSFINDLLYGSVIAPKSAPAAKGFAALSAPAGAVPTDVQAEADARIAAGTLTL